MDPAKLKAGIARRGMTQRQFAADCGISESALSRYLSGVVLGFTHGPARAIARRLRVPWRSLYYDGRRS